MNPLRARARNPETKKAKELLIASGILAGKTHKQISEETGIPEGTVGRRAAEPTVKTILTEFLERQNERLTRSMDHMAEHIDMVLDPAKVGKEISKEEAAAARCKVDAANTLVRLAGEIDRSQQRLAQQQQLAGVVAGESGWDLEDFQVFWKRATIRALRRERAGEPNGIEQK